MTGVELGIENMTQAEVIGEGGFASVYAATDSQLDRRVAVKVLRHNLSESAGRKFDRECAIMGRLSSHPNVVTVHSAGYTEHGRPYLVMELLDGGSLGERLKNSGLIGWVEAVGYMIPVAEALAVAHEAGILHRDVKPDNILLTGDEPRLTDFGIAQLREAASDTTGEVVASWHHTPPETLDDDRDERSDIYSLASTLYMLIAGHAPFWAEDHSLVSMVHRMVKDPPPDLPADLCPPELNEFFRRALAKDPTDRPQSATELAEELRRLKSLGLRNSIPVVPPRPLVSGLRRAPVVWAAFASIATAALIVAGLTILDNLDDDFSIAGQPDGAGGAEEVAAPSSDSAGSAVLVNRGTYQAPYPFGQSVTLFYDDLETGTEREWALQLLEPVVDRTEEVAAEPPIPEHRLASTRMRLTYYDGADPGQSGDLRFQTVGQSGAKFAPTMQQCGAEEERLDLRAELAISDSVEGWVCWWVPADEFTSLVLAVEAEPAAGAVYLELR